jgi:NAD(P)-dependent dehydrogenase (short-subunit alcohol dehydrogenase family)
MTQRLAAELGPRGVRAVCLRPHAIPDAAANGSYTGDMFGPLAAAEGVSLEQLSPAVERSPAVRAVRRRSDSGFQAIPVCGAPH